MMHRVLTVSCFHIARSMPVPALRLQGIWLKSLDFPVRCRGSITGSRMEQCLDTGGTLKCSYIDME